MYPYFPYKVVLRLSGKKSGPLRDKPADHYSDKLIHVRSPNIHVRGPIDSRAWI